MMSELWTPDAANAENESVADTTVLRQLAIGKRLSEELTRLDPNLDCVFVGERAPEAFGVKPGRWHIRRRNSKGGPDGYLPIETPEGEYAEPSLAIIDTLKRNDLWNPQAMERLTQSWKRAADDAERRREHEAELRKEEGTHIFRAAKRVAGEGGMTKRKWARR